MNRKIDGTFFEFHHHNTPEGKYWNSTIDQFTAENWREKVREISNLGMEYIVVMATALYEKCYFKSSVFPFADIPCTDPIEELLQEADNCDIKVFLGNGFYGDWTKANKNITSKTRAYIVEYQQKLIRKNKIPPKPIGRRKNMKIGIIADSLKKELFAALKEALVLRGVPCGDVEVRYAPGRPGDIPHSFADVSRAERELGYRSLYDIKSGIREMVGYYMEHFSGK